MELDLTSFSLTLAVGLALVLIVYFGLRITYPHAAEHVAAWLGAHSEQGQRWLPLLGTGVILLGVGIICEDISKNVLGEREPVVFGTQLDGLLDTEREERCRKIINSKYCNPNGSMKTSEKAIRQAKVSDDVMSDLGFRVITQLGELDAASRASPEEKRLYQEISYSNRLPKVPCREKDNIDRHARCVEVAPELENKLADTVLRLYYVAKNTVYLNDVYQSELEAIRLRYSFERSLAFVLILGTYVVIFIFLAKSAVAMWTDVGGWKTGFGLILLLLLILAAFDISTTSEVLRKSLCDKDSACASRVDMARAWLLPATLGFVVAYRVRRVGRRLGPWMYQSSRSTISRSRLLVYEREVEAWRVLRLVVVLAALLIPTSWAYIAEHDHYLGRVFGYYETLRGTELQSLERSAD